MAWGNASQAVVEAERGQASAPDGFVGPGDALYNEPVVASRYTLNLNRLL